MEFLLDDNQYFFFFFTPTQGMGGQFDYFGLWIDQDYGKGHSRAKPKCTTYDSPQLSGSENFVIDCVEVWAVGPLPKKDTEVRPN